MSPLNVPEYKIPFDPYAVQRIVCSSPTLPNIPTMNCMIYKDSNIKNVEPHFQYKVYEAFGSAEAQWVVCCVSLRKSSNKPPISIKPARGLIRRKHNRRATSYFKKAPTEQLLCSITSFDWRQKNKKETQLT